MSAASHTPAITGILVPHMVPLDAKGRIDEEELFRYVQWLVDRGVHGLYPNGSTGEFLRFTVEERRKIVQIVCKAAAGRVPVVAGAAEGTAAETIRACEHCLEAGARAVAVVAPYYYRLSAESVEAYFREIGAHSPIDVTLYHIPMLASPIKSHSAAASTAVLRKNVSKRFSGSIASWTLCACSTGASDRSVSAAS